MAERKMRMLKITLTKEGAKMRSPNTGEMMVHGKEYEVPDAKFWHRRIKDKTVTLVGRGKDQVLPDLSGKKEPPQEKPKSTRSAKSIKKSDD